MTEIRYKKVLVTGAAHGMGLRMAEQFAIEGAELLLVDIDEEGLAEAAAAFERRGQVVHTYTCDLTDYDQIKQLRSTIFDEVGPIDILVNNAGVVFGGRYEDIDEAQDELTLDVNIRGVHRMTKTFLEDLKTSPSGHLVQMASASGFIGIPYQVLYSASKWFVIGFSEALRQELDKEGASNVGMTIVCPSLVDTGMFEGSQPPMLAPLLAPDFIAERVIDAVRHDELYVKEPFIVKMIPTLRALLPTDVVDFLLEHLGATKIMHGWRGGEEAG